MSKAPSNYDAWAELYDRTLGPDYSARKMGFLERRLLDRLPAGARVLDLCCGSGRMMAPMLARGFAVSGLDLSADMLRLIGVMLEVPRLGCPIVYGVSDNEESWWDNSETAYLGWKPQDSSAQFAHLFADDPAQDPNDPEMIYQGGKFAKAGHFED